MIIIGLFSIGMSSASMKAAGTPAAVYCEYMQRDKFPPSSPEPEAIKAGVTAYCVLQSSLAAQHGIPFYPCYIAKCWVALLCRTCIRWLSRPF